MLTFNDYFINEARTITDDKFQWITSRLADWIWEEIQENPNFIKTLKRNQCFRDFENSKGFSLSNDESTKEKLETIENYLNVLTKKESNDFIKFISDNSEFIRGKFSRFGKSEIVGKRGRPEGSKNKPKVDKAKKVSMSEYDEKSKIIDISITSISKSINSNKELIISRKKGIERKKEEIQKLEKEIKEISQYIDESEKELSKKNNELKELKVRYTSI